MTVLSADAVSTEPSSRHSTSQTAASCPASTAVHCRVLRSHTRTVLSHETETSCPEGVSASPQTVSVCPSRTPTIVLPSLPLASECQRVKIFDSSK